MQKTTRSFDSRSQVSGDLGREEVRGASTHRGHTLWHRCPFKNNQRRVPFPNKDEKPDTEGSQYVLTTTPYTRPVTLLPPSLRPSGSPDWTTLKIEESTPDWVPDGRRAPRRTLTPAKRTLRHGMSSALRTTATGVSRKEERVVTVLHEGHSYFNLHRT